MRLVLQTRNKGSTPRWSKPERSAGNERQRETSIPIESLALLVGFDRFMSECRAITNLIGNGVATVVISRWEKEITPAALNEAMSNPKSIVDLAADPA